MMYAALYFAGVVTPVVVVTLALWLLSLGQEPVAPNACGDELCWRRCAFPGKHRCPFAHNQ